jgi:hypothetical protein
LKGDKAMSRILISVVLGMLTAVCIYTAYITGKSENTQGSWFFGVFSLLFAIPLLIIIIKALGQKISLFRRLFDKLAGPQQEGVRFVPHWIMMLVMFIVGIAVLVNILRIVFRF